jgi:hypothetical protein
MTAKEALQHPFLAGCAATNPEPAPYLPNRSPFSADEEAVLEAPENLFENVSTTRFA